LGVGGELSVPSRFLDLVHASDAGLQCCLYGRRRCC
jgi:hypothetical protein